MSNKLEQAINWIAGGFPGWHAARNRSRAESAYYDAARRAAGTRSRRASMSYRGTVTTRLDETPPSGFGQSGIRQPTQSGYQFMSRRAQNLVNNNVLASSMLGSSVDFVIGSGTRIEPLTDDTEFNKRVGDKWRDYWVGENGSSPEVRGMFNGPKLERIKYRQRLRDGDGGVILLGSGKIQSIRGSLIESPQGSTANRNIVDGLELNARGAAVAYWVRTTDAAKPFRRAWKRIRAQDFVHNARIMDEDQIRGETVYAQSFELFEQLDGYIDGVIVAARMAAMFGLLIREDTKSFGGYTGPLISDGNGTDRPSFDLEAGMVKRLGPTDEVTQVKPEQPTSNFEQLVTTLVRFAGIEMNLPLEIAFLDFSRTNYSSARAAMEIAKRSATADHQDWTSEFISPIYRWRVSKWIKEGELEPPSDGGKPWAHRAVQQPYPYIDPAKDAAGLLMLRDGGFKSYEECLAERDTTAEKLAASNARSQATLDKHGVTIGRSRAVDFGTDTTAPVTNDAEEDKDDE